MPANAIRDIALTLYGQTVSGVVFAVAESLHWDLTFQSPATRGALDLTGATVVLSLCAFSITGDVVQPPLIQKTAAITVPATDGKATVDFIPSDSAAIPPGSYFLDVTLTDSAGNRMQMLFGSLVSLRPAGSLPA